MPVKGSDILKNLPHRKGCRECGFPTCFAFAMKLVSGGTTIDTCPYLSPEAKEEIEEALAPPITLVTIGSGKNALRIGNEESLYRHETPFVNQPGFALLISDKEDEASIEEKLRKIKELKFTWAGLTLQADLLSLHFESGDRTKFIALVKKVYESTDLGIIVISEDLEALFAARDICSDRHPLLYPITKENIQEAIPKITMEPTPVGVRAGSVEELIPLTSQLKAAGVEEVVLDPGAQNLFEAIRDQTFIRRAALKQNVRPLGYPTIAFPCFIAEDGLQEILTASSFIIKYAGIIVLSDIDRYLLLPLLVHRLNIYTNPHVPLTVEEGVYEIGKPDAESPVLLTSNWALTYLLLSSAIEATNIPTFLCVKSLEEADVLCWCHHCLRSVQMGTLSGGDIKQFIKKCGIEDRVRHRKLVISERAARFKAELEQALPNWEIIVGPDEAARIAYFLPEFVQTL